MSNWLEFYVIMLMLLVVMLTLRLLGILPIRFRKGGKMPSKYMPICVPCEKEMVREKNGVVVEEHRRGLDVHTIWGGYKIWSADLWRCPKCGHLVISGFGDRPLAHHHEARYADEKKNVEYHIR